MVPTTRVRGFPEMPASDTGIIGAVTTTGSVGSQWNSLRHLSMNAACCSSDIRPRYLR